MEFGIALNEVLYSTASISTRTRAFLFFLPCTYMSISCWNVYIFILLISSLLMFNLLHVMYY